MAAIDRGCAYKVMFLFCLLSSVEALDIHEAFRAQSKPGAKAELHSDPTALAELEQKMPGHHHHHHHGPRPGAVLGGITAGLVIGSMIRPPRPVRVPAVFVSPSAQRVYVMHGGTMMMQIMVTAPTWCQPCQNEPMQVNVGATTYYITTPPNVWASQTFAAYVPAPVVSQAAPLPVVTQDPIVPAVLVSEDGEVKTMSVQVPQHKYPGQQVRVRMPEGDIRILYVPSGASHPNTFTFPYNPVAEARAREERERELQRRRALAQLRSKIVSSHRCCCAEQDGNCLWYKNDLLTKKLLSNGHCPRLQERPYMPICTASSCGFFSKHGCTKTHHSSNLCPVSDEARFYFVGDTCRSRNPTMSIELSLESEGTGKV